MFAASIELRLCLAGLLAIGPVPARANPNLPNSQDRANTPVDSSGKAIDFSSYELIGTDGVQAPHVLKSPAPKFSDTMQEPRPEGAVGMCALVNERGKVDSVIPIAHQDKNPELTQAALAAVKQWEFDPATKDGRPVPVRIDLNVRFEGAEPKATVLDYYHVGCGIAPPRTIKAPDPKYTKAARKAKIQGAVVLWLVVNAQGLPEHIRLQKSLDAGLDQCAVDAVQRWKFHPAMGNNKPVAVMINVEVNFKLY
jgi:TonB family protein